MEVISIELTQEQYDNMLSTKELLETFLPTDGGEEVMIIKQAFENHIATIKAIENGKK